MKIRRRLAHGRTRISKIFTTGVRPALGYGSIVNGASDRELRDANRLLAAGHGPTTCGTSLSCKLALHGDVTGGMGYAPALAWATEVWLAFTDAPGPHLLPEELHSIWQSAKPWEVRTW